MDEEALSQKAPLSIVPLRNLVQIYKKKPKQIPVSPADVWDERKKKGLKNINLLLFNHDSFHYSETFALKM